MSDLETRLSEALRGAGERAPQPGDLVAPAHVRLRRRRRTTAAVVAAAVAVVAVPLGVALGEGGEQSTDRQDPTVVDSVPSDWRVESYRDLTLRVPPDWTYGGGTDWCLDGEDPQSAPPQVSRAGGAVRAIACRPAYGYGVVFAPEHLDVFLGDETFPSDAHYDTFGTEQARVWIAAESEEQLRQIVASAHEIDGVDANGCPPIVDPDSISSSERVSVCRYDSGELEQSELLSVEDSAATVTAVGRTKSAMPTSRLPCPAYSFRQPKITMRSSDLDVSLLPSSTCPLSYTFLDAERLRVLTEDVLYWALTPGTSLGATSDLPLPEELRTSD